MRTELMQVKRGSDENQANKWFHANHRPGYLVVHLFGDVCEDLHASRAQGFPTRKFSVVVQVEDDTSKQIAFGPSEEFRFQRVWGHVRDHHKLKLPSITFVSTEPEPGELLLWEYFTERSYSNGELELMCKLCTNLTSKQHSCARLQVRVQLWVQQGEAALVDDATTVAVPFLARPPSGKEPDIELVSDCRPGKLVMFVGKGMRCVGRGSQVQHTCQLQRVSDGTVWDLRREERKACPTAFVTRLPRGIPLGEYMLRISNLDLDARQDSKVFNIVVTENSNLPHTVSPDAQTVSIQPKFEPLAVSNAACIKQEPGCSGSNATCIERQPSFSSLNTTFLERQPSLSSLNTTTFFERQPSLSSLNSTFLERQPSLSSLNSIFLERQSSLSSLNATFIERDLSFSQRFQNECQNPPLDSRWLASVPSSVQRNPLMSPWLVSPICSQLATSEDSMGDGAEFGGPFGYGIGAS